MRTFFSRFFPHDGDATLAFHQAVQRRLTDVFTILDFGCGDNSTFGLYRTWGHRVWGADFQRHPHLADPTWFQSLDPTGTAPFADGSFDVIAARWVLEHVKDPDTFLAEAARLLRPGGWLVALTVNAAHYVSWLTRLLGLLPHAVTQHLARCLYGRPVHDTFPTWYRLNTPAAVGRAARRTGLEVAQVERLANADYFSFSRPLHHAAVLADWLLEALGTELGRIYLIVTLHKPAVGARPAFRRAG